jgi:hypothetical protein
MAKKLPAGKAAPRKAAPATEGADDLAIIHPDVTETIAGRRITVREYGFIEGLRVRAFMRPFTADLAAVFAAGGEALVEDVLDLLGDHIDVVQQAIAQSIATPGELASDEDLAWVRGLDDADGDLLVNLWWGVCGLFFVRQVVRRTAERARRAAFAGATSTAPSSAPASARPSSSGGTPNASSSSSTSDSSPSPTGAAPT